MSDEPKYEIIIYWSEEDGAFIAEVPELSGCAADGTTRQEALANAQTIIAEWIETARDLGRSIPTPIGTKLRTAEYSGRKGSVRKEKTGKKGKGKDEANSPPGGMCSQRRSSLSSFSLLPRFPFFLSYTPWDSQG